MSYLSTDERIREMARQVFIDLTLESPLISGVERFREAVSASTFFESAWARYEQGLPIDGAYLADED